MNDHKKNDRTQTASRRNSCVPLAICCLALALVFPAPAMAGEADDLAKTIDSGLRTAERLMFNGQKAEADESLKAAETMLADMAAMDPDHAKLKTLESKYNKLRNDLNKRIGVSATTSSERPLPPKPAPASNVPAAAARPASDPAVAAATKLPAGVSKRLGEIDSALDEAEAEVSDGDLENARYALERVPGLFEEIDRMYAGQFPADHSDYAGTRARYLEVQASIEAGATAEAEATAEAARAAAASEADAMQWLERFGAYISGSYMPAGHKPAKELVFPGTAYPEKIAATQGWYAEAKSLYAEFQQSGLASSDLPWQVQQAADDLKFAIEGYESSSQSATSGFTQEAESNLDQALAQLSATAWKDDPAALPPMIDEAWRERIDAAIGNLRTVLPANDPKLAELEEKQSRMLALDQENRAAWQQRIRIRPEVYGGDDLADIRSKAEDIVRAKDPGAEILRVSIYQDDWKEESVIESTDSTNTAIRHRTTRIINGQVAAKSNDEVLLHTLHIAKDRQSDGGWGKLYGHIMYSDRMSAEHVDD